MNVKRLIAVALALLLALGAAGFAPTEAKAAAPTVSLTASVQTASDDMEEWFSDGVLDYNSSDLEIGLEKPGTEDGTPQYVGIRFAGLAIPQGATIESAYIQFTVDEVKSPANPFDVNIYGEDTDNSVTFNNGSTGASVASHDISSRARTSDSVNWSLDTDDSLWTVIDEAAEKEQTPDLSSLIQDVVNRSGWVSGNAISFIMYGTGNRTAISYDKDPSKAPVLHLTYSYNGTLEQAAPTGLAGVAPTSSASNDGKITGTTAEMEYKLSADSTWTTCSDGETAGLTAGIYSVRYSEKEGYNASSFIDVEIPEYIFIPDPPAGLAGVPLTAATSGDGMIMGVTDQMEYKKSYQTEWTTCPNAVITGLSAGLYNVRYAATADAEASEAVDVAVSAVTKVVMSIYDDDSISANATNAMGFTWYTVAESQASDLQIVKKTSKAPNFEGKNVISFTGKTTVPTNAISTNESQAQEYLHKAVATGLKKNTAYCFRVGDASLDLWSETGTFTTSSGKGAFTFLDLADPQAKELEEAQLAASTFESAVKTVPDADFIAINGDIVDKGSLEYEWDWLFNNMSDVMLSYPIAPIAGNHESQTNSFINHFNICPVSGSDTATGAYYSFDYSNAHFVMLNTNENSTTYSDFSEAQVNWMISDITAAKADGKWIIVLLHKGPYTTSNHATDSDIMGATGVRTLIAPIFANLGVDLVLQGHDHIYARSKAIGENGSAAASNIITEVYNGRETGYQVNPDGSIYLIPATAGPKVYYKNASSSLTGTGYYGMFDVADESHSSPYGSDPSDSSRPLRSMVDNFESITIDGDKLTVVSYEIDHGGLLSNTDEPYVIDTFGIVKDTKAPVLKVNGIAKNQTFKLNQKVAVKWSANDGSGTGVKTSSANAVVNGLLDTSTCGKHTVTFTATDYAGNTSAKSFTYNVVYKFSGYLAPLSFNGRYKAGSTLPVMFYLKDAKGVLVKNATAKLYIAKQKANGKFGPETAAVSRVLKNDNQFKCFGGIYLFDLSTKSLAAGTYQLRIDLGDGSVNTTQIKLR